MSRACLNKFETKTWWTSPNISSSFASATFSIYDAEQVQEVWKSIIELDINIKDPYYAKDNAEYRDLISNALKTINRKKKASKSSYKFQREPFRSAPYFEQKVIAELFRFESRMANIQHDVCTKCHECSLNMSVRLSDSVCARCRRKPTSESNSMLRI